MPPASHPPPSLPVFEFDVTPDTPLTGEYDIDAVLATIPATQLVKGMFFSRHVARLGAEWPEVARLLMAPPRLGRYLTFSDYPIRDYSRVAHEVGARSHARLPRHEALRRTARDDQREFAASTLGSVMFAMVSDAKGLLMLYPDAYHRCTTGQKVAAEPFSGGVRLRYRNMFGIGAYTVGQIEGMVLSQQPTCRVRGRHDPSAGELELEAWL